MHVPREAILVVGAGLRGRDAAYPLKQQPTAALAGGQIDGGAAGVAEVGAELRPRRRRRASCRPRRLQVTLLLLSQPVSNAAGAIRSPAVRSSFDLVQTRVGGHVDDAVLADDRRGPCCRLELSAGPDLEGELDTAVAIHPTLRRGTEGLAGHEVTSVRAHTRPSLVPTTTNRSPLSTGDVSTVVAGARRDRRSHCRTVSDPMHPYRTARRAQEPSWFAQRAAVDRADSRSSSSHRLLSRQRTGRQTTVHATVLFEIKYPADQATLERLQLAVEIAHPETPCPAGR